LTRAGKTIVQEVTKCTPLLEKDNETKLNGVKVKKALGKKG